MSERAGFGLRIATSTPYDWAALAGFLAPRAVPCVEAVRGGAYQRSVRLPTGWAVLRASMAPARTHLRVRVQGAPADGAREGLRRALSRVFDVTADASAIAAVLGADPRLASSVSAAPGLRVPGAWDGFELAVRAILGQQVTVRGATTLAGRLAQRFGSVLPAEARAEGVGLGFPPPERLAEAQLSLIGIPRARARAISALAGAVAAGGLRLEKADDLEAYVAALTALPGIGAWTAHYVAMRAGRAGDAFPAADVALRRAVARAEGRPLALSPRALEQRAEAWRPYRAYAAMHLWRMHALAGARGGG